MKFFCCVFCLIIFFSCKNKQVVDDLLGIKKSDSNQTLVLNNSGYELDLNELIQIRGVSYSKDDFSTHLDAYFDSTNNPVIFKEFYLNNDLYFAERNYYFEKSKLIYVSDYQERYVDSVFVALEYEYFYKNDTLIKSTKKEVTSDDSIEEALPIEIKPKKIVNFKFYLSDMLSQSGYFQLYFDDVKDYGDNGVFIRAKLKSPFYWESYFKVEKEDDFIRDLIKNKNKYKGKAIDVEYFYAYGSNGAEFMYYSKASFVE